MKNREDRESHAARVENEALRERPWWDPSVRPLHGDTMQDEVAKSDAPALLSVEEAAHRLGRISAWTLRKHIAQGNVSVIRIGRRVLIRTEEVQRICASGLPSLKQVS